MRIGILGGIGPEATGQFYLKLIESLQMSGKIGRNEDFPQILINSIPAPELIIDGEADLTEYKKGLKELDSHSPDFIAMVCNTIHLYHDELQSNVDAEVLDLRQEVRKAIGKRTKVTVIGTPSTISMGLYEFPGIEYLNPDMHEMQILSDAVFEFNRGNNKDLQRKKVEEIARKYLAIGSQTVILGCTEFAVMLEKSNIPKINSIDVLVDAVKGRCIM